MQQPGLGSGQQHYGTTIQQAGSQHIPQSGMPVGMPPGSYLITQSGHAVSQTQPLQGHFMPSNQARPVGSGMYNTMQTRQPMYVNQPQQQPQVMGPGPGMMQSQQISPQPQYQQYTQRMHGGLAPHHQQTIPPQGMVQFRMQPSYVPGPSPTGSGMVQYMASRPAIATQASGPPQMQPQQQIQQPPSGARSLPVPCMMPSPTGAAHVAHTQTMGSHLPQQPQRPPSTGLPAATAPPATAVAATPFSTATSTLPSATTSSTMADGPPILTKQRLEDLVREVDPHEQLDDDVKDVMLQIADEFVDSVVNSACLLAKHRGATSLSVKDVQLVLERNYNMWIPGFGNEEIRPYKKAAVTEAHKQRTALIKKTLKKM